MPRLLFALALIMTFFVSSGTGQQSSTPSLSTMLNDANYTFNRYEELAGEMNCDGLRTATEKLRQQCRNLVQLTTKNVRDAKEALNRALKAPVPSLTDLFDIYSELIEVGTNLDGFSDQILMFSDGNANSYAQASAKASVLAANLGNAIRFRIVLVEANCSKQK